MIHLSGSQAVMKHMLICDPGCMNPMNGRIHQLAAGDLLKVGLCHDDYSIWFSIEHQR